MMSVLTKFIKTYSD